MTTSPDRGGAERIRSLIRLFTVTFTIAAVVKELRLPSDERTWHGSIAGFVPYDFRKPTPERVRDRLWAPHSSELLTPTVFGVGWTVNLGRVVELARSIRRG